MLFASPLSRFRWIVAPRAWFTGLACAALLCGCSSDHQPCSVSGGATFRGEPIEDGVIRFVTHDKTPGPGGLAPIKDGQYAVTTQGMLSGSYLVTISGFKKTGRTLTIDGNQVEEKLQYVPAKYNSQATEVITLTPGPNALEFSLKP